MQIQSKGGGTGLVKRTDFTTYSKIDEFTKFRYKPFASKISTVTVRLLCSIVGELGHR